MHVGTIVCDMVMGKFHEFVEGQCDFMYAYLKGVTCILNIQILAKIICTINQTLGNITKGVYLEVEIQKHIAQKGVT